MVLELLGPILLNTVHQQFKTFTVITYYDKSTYPLQSRVVVISYCMLFNSKFLCSLQTENIQPYVEEINKEKLVLLEHVLSKQKINSNF